jgi:hypothetical protein
MTLFGVRGVVRGVRVEHVQDKQLGVARSRRLGGRLDGQVRRRRRVRSHQDLAPSVVASFVHGTVCPEATSGDGAGTFLVMGCRHALWVCGDEPRIGSPPPLVDPGLDGSIST